MMNWKRFWRKRSQPNLKYYPSITLDCGKAWKTRHYSQFPGRDFNPGPSEYKAAALTTRPQRLGSEFWHLLDLQVGTMFLWSVAIHLKFHRHLNPEGQHGQVGRLLIVWQTLLRIHILSFIYLEVILCTCVFHISLFFLHSASWTYGWLVHECSVKKIWR
jgi:hypothetical protein